MAGRISSIIKILTEPRPVSSSWIISCLLFGGALGLRLFFGSWLEPNKFLTFYPAVAAAAIIGGWLEGCMVALLSALAAWCFFFEPRYTFGTADKNLVPLLIGFLSVSGFLIWIVALLRDAVRELQHEVAARKQAEASLRQGDRRKDEFLATLAHELRNPLAPIHNVTQVLRKKHGPGDPDAPLLDMVDRQVNHLVHLVDDLLEISRINLDKVELHKERVDLTALLRDAMEASEPLFEKKGHCVTLSLPSEPLWVDADPVRVTQVAANLLSNAAKYTPPHGAVQIAITRDGDAAVLRVRDNGVGLPADMLTRVFDLFTQIKSGASHSDGGLGVGLALARKLVELHGGNIEAQSAGPALGSEFVVRFPLSRDTAAVSPQKSSGSEQAESDSDRPRRVLVIDDEKDVADSLGLFLKSLGAIVQVVYDGLSGVSAMEDFKPELVFVDIGMPGVDGYETARLLCRSRRRQKFVLVALTGWGQKEDRRRTQEAGYDLHLTKPAPTKAVKELLKRAA